MRFVTNKEQFDFISAFDWKLAPNFTENAQKDPLF